MKWRSIVFLITLFVLITGYRVSGQVSSLPLSDEERSFKDASVNGRVKDRNGKPVSKATVILQKLDEAAFKKQVKSSSKGFYGFSNLPTGKYKITVILPNAPLFVKTFDLEASSICRTCLRPSLHGENKHFDIPINTVIKTKSSEKPIDSSTPTPPDKRAIDKIIENMEEGNFAFNFPEKIYLDKIEPVTLELSLKDSMEQLAQKMKDEGLKGKIVTDTTKVATLMQPVLTGDGIEIKSVISDPLPVSSQQTTKWTWDVRAARSGSLRLHLVLYAIINYKDDNVEIKNHPLKVYDKDYIVETPWSQTPAATFAVNNYQWLWTTLIVPFALALWGWWKKRNRSELV